ncbi:MAG: DUF177 domain-containing protein [Clostridia bacterium]|nr:DUF177 domain-containing protein [Clostridia bacterium]
MTLDMRAMIKGLVDEIPVDGELCPDSPTGVTFDRAAHVCGRVTNEGGYMRLILEVEVPYTGECARCLCAVSGVFRMSYERTVVNEGTLSDEQLEDNVDEYVVIVDGELDLAEELRDALFLSFPMRLLCSEECAGLCPKCGKPRRDGPCSCAEREIDPRLAILATLLDENEEK